jgi:hypothetical protein
MSAGPGPPPGPAFLIAVFLPSGREEESRAVHAARKLDLLRQLEASELEAAELRALVGNLSTRRRGAVQHPLGSSRHLRASSPSAAGTAGGSSLAEAKAMSNHSDSDGSRTH